MLRKGKKLEHGWSLVEIMVAIVIMGILCSIAVFSYGQIRNRGDQLSLTNNSKTLESALQQYWVGNNKLFPVAVSKVPMTTNNPAPVFTPSDPKIKIEYFVSSTRKVYCYNMTIGKQTKYFKYNSTTVSKTPYTSATCV